MTYAGSGLKLISQGIGGNAQKIWAYSSTDAVTTVRVTGYFSDGYFRGMRVGDLVLVLDSDASPITGSLCWVTDVNLTTGVADISDGVTITGTDSD